MGSLAPHGVRPTAVCARAPPLGSTTCPGPSGRRSLLNIGADIDACRDAKTLAAVQEVLRVHMQAEGRLKKDLGRLPGRRQ